MRLFIILLIGAAFSFGANFYIYKRFVKRIGFAQRWLKILRVIFCVIAPLEFLVFVQIRFDILPIWVYILASTLLAMSWFLLAIAIIYDISHNFFGSKPYDHGRRKFLKICFDVSFVIIFASFFLKGLFTALTPPKLNFTKIKLKNLHSPLRIAMISDVHIGEFLQKDFLARLVSNINSVNPDMLVIVGDMIDFDASHIGDILEPLQEIRARYGIFYVPGNHEYYHGIEPIMEKISATGVQILGNKNVELDEINIAGVYDLAGIRFGKFLPDLNSALSGANPQKPVVLLAHQPKFIKTMSKSVDLVLCGHTHGGQIFPFHLLVKFDQGFLRGLYQINDKMQAYVSPGAGFWGPPVRIFAPNEIAILDLIGE